MTRTATVTLEHGLRRDGAKVRRVELRVVTGEDELALAELPGLGMAARTTELLARTVERIGDRQGASRDELRALSVGDRERLMLELYCLSFGGAPDLSALCPGCGEPLEFPVSLADLILPPAPDAELEHSAPLGHATVRFHLPTGEDQEAAAELAGADYEAGALLLLQRCLMAEPDADPHALRDLLAERFAALDPQAETLLDAECPACAAPTQLLVDAAALVFARMARPERVMAEVDRIARVYHWSEREILALPATRRRAYLDLIAESWAAS